MAERETEIARERYDKARSVDPDASDQGEEEAHELDAGREHASRGH